MRFPLYSAMFVFVLPVITAATGFFLEMERNLACQFVCSNMESCGVGRTSYCVESSETNSACFGVFYTADGTGNYCTMDDSSCDVTNPVRCCTALSIYQAYIAFSESTTSITTTEEPMMSTQPPPSTVNDTEPVTLAANETDDTTTTVAPASTPDYTTASPQWTTPSPPETSTFSAINTFPTSTITTEASTTVHQPDTTTAYVFHPFRRP